MSKSVVKEPMIDECHRTLINDIKIEFVWGVKLKDTKTGKKILALSPEEQIHLMIVITEWLSYHRNKPPTKGLQHTDNGLVEVMMYDPTPWGVQSALIELLKLNLTFEQEQIITLLKWSLSQATSYERGTPQMIKIVENHLKQNPLTSDLKQTILKLAEKILAGDYQNAQDRKWAIKLKELAGVKSERNPLVSGEAWSDVAIADVEKLFDEKKSAWIQLFSECQKASGASPSVKWIKTTKPLVEKIGFDSFKASLLKWFPLVDKPRTERIETWSEWAPDPNQLLNDVNADILKGLVWLCAWQKDKDLARALTVLAISAYKKVAMIGPRCVRVGNACVYALGAMEGMEGVERLALLKLKVKVNNVQKVIEKALGVAAKRLNLSPEEIEEMSVPNYGLTEVGSLREEFENVTAELLVTGTNAAELRWFNQDGKEQRSVPKSVKENHAEELKELNQAIKDIKKLLPAQRDRIENLYLEQKVWKLKTWRERYLDHPLIGTLSRRLIWLFSNSDKKFAGIWFNGKIVDVNGKPLEWLNDESDVELWHPLDATTNEILAWREFFSEEKILQPFKQAHREVYLLTDAERNTQVYSNRFAAHIIKQHQFNALCAIRGWKNQLRLMVDDECTPPVRVLKKWNMRAEFWVESVGDNYGTDTTESGTFLYLATDQVRFYPIDAQQHYAHASGGGYATGWNYRGQLLEPIQMEEIPPLVFSEIMRDVDLFVGVCSIGNDPAWLDGGRAENRDYWYSYSFGDLTETAKTRREVLSKLIPRLKIASRCELEDKFLYVRGDIRTYKIHLGSGNILMLPNDQYLCIVPSRSEETAKDKVFLPFEGDRTLAIILSKAFLLAEDTKIKDTTITRQINFET